MSRPEKPIDWDRVEYLMMSGCSGAEIAPHFNLHPDTFYDRVRNHYGDCFTVISGIKKGQGDSLLKETQFSKAIGVSEKGDNTMLIWLGKQRLEQREPESKPPEYKHETDMERVINHLEANGLQQETDRELQPEQCEDQHLGGSGS